MSITLTTIADAILARLTTLKGATVGQFKHVGHYAGEFANAEMQEDTFLSQTPAALLALDLEDTAPTTEKLNGQQEHVGASTWAVLIAARDPRGHAQTVKSQTGTSGAYAMADAAIGALTGLKIAGAWKNKRLRYLGLRPMIQRPGLLYVLALRFTADREIARAAYTDTTNPLSIRIDQNLQHTPADTVDGNPNPTQRVKSP